MAASVRVLVAEEGLARLRGAGEVLVRTGLSESELAEQLPGMDAVIVRSRTRVSAEALAPADGLRVIGRAGVGVDNIDVDAATRREILVLNTPESIYIANMHVGRRDVGAAALMDLTIDAPAQPAVVREIERAHGISKVKAVRL